MVDKFIKTTVPQIISTLSTQRPNFQPQFSALTTNADRVQFCQADEEIQRQVSLFVSASIANQNVSKYSETSTKFREKGNVLFRAQNYQQAIQLYSTALRFAPKCLDTASELAFAYGNRAAAYIQVGQYENALKDIEDALAVGYARFKPATKLQLRKCDCLIRLGLVSETKEFLQLMKQPTVGEDDINRLMESFDRINLDNKKKSKVEISLAEKLTQKGLFKSNPKMSSLSTKVAVRYDSEKGRHLVAQEDIKFGDVLALSRPFATLLNSNGDAVKCHHCCRDMFREAQNMVSIRPIPCTRCSSVMYCSEECRAESNDSYHRYECGQYDLLIQLPDYLRMSLRMLYSADMDQIRSVVSAEKGMDSSHFSEQPENHYSHLYHLVHFTDGPLKDLNISYEEMLKLSIYTCVLVELIKLGQGQFRMNTKEEEKLIGGILLRHQRQLHYNAFEYCPLNEASSPSLISMNLYPVFSSSLNHSCNANARLESPNNEYACLLQAARPISAGTEITISYLNDDEHVHGISLTHEQLFRYFSRCNCASCTYQNRNMPFLESNYYPLSCSNCGHLMERSSEQRSQLEIFHCTKCRLEVTHVQLQRRYRQLDQFGNLSIWLIGQLKLNGFKSSALALWKQFESTTEQVEAFFHHASSLYVGNHRYMLSFYYRDIGQLDKWWACIEPYLTVIEYLFGAESMQFIQVFDLIQHLHVETLEKVQPKLMQTFKEQHNKLYQRYLARVEQWKQLRHKYYPHY